MKEIKLNWIQSLIVRASEWINGRRLSRNEIIEIKISTDIISILVNAGIKIYQLIEYLKYIKGERVPREKYGSNLLSYNK